MQSDEGKGAWVQKAKCNVPSPAMLQIVFSQLGSFLVQLLGRNPCWEGEVGGTLEFHLSSCYRVHRAEWPKGHRWDKSVFLSRAPRAPSATRNTDSKESCFRRKACSCEGWISPFWAVPELSPVPCWGGTARFVLAPQGWPTLATECETFPMSLICSVFTLNQISRQIFSLLVPISPLCHFALHTPLLSHLCAGVCA